MHALEDTTTIHFPNFARTNAANSPLLCFDFEYSYVIFLFDFFFSLFHLLHRCSNLKATKHIFLGRFVQSFRENTFCRSIGIASRGKLGFVAGQQYRVDSEQSHQTERVTSLLSIALVDHDLVRLVALLRYLIKSKCATCVGIFKDSPSK